MGKLVYGMNQSLDGYVDKPGALSSPHRASARPDGQCVRSPHDEVMRCWDEDCPGWGAEGHDFAVAWRGQPKWVVSRSLKLVGPTATLVEDEIEAVIRGLKAQLVGEI